MTTNKRPKSLRVPTEAEFTQEPSISRIMMVAATLGASIKNILAPSNTGYILIVVDEEGAVMATSEDPEEAINVLSHFAQDKRLIENGLRVRECPCSQCEAFRRGEGFNGVKH